MIESHLQANTGYLLLEPNRSLSWRGNKWLLASVGVIMGTSSTGFALLGLWPILPFAGIELMALATALYFTALKQRYREVITFTDSEVLLQRGRSHPEEEYRFPRQWANFIVRISPYRAHPPRLMLRCHGREVEVGRCIGEDEKERLIAALRAVTHRGVPELADCPGAA